MVRDRINHLRQEDYTAGDKRRDFRGAFKGIQETGRFNRERRPSQGADEASG